MGTLNKMAQALNPNLLNRVGLEWDIEKISITNFGDTAANILIEVVLLLGKSTTTPDPNLPTELDIKVFDKFGSKAVLKLTFGQLGYILALASNDPATGLDPQSVALFNSNSVGYWFQSVSQIKSLFALLKLARPYIPENTNSFTVILPDEITDITVKQL